MTRLLGLLLLTGAALAIAAADKKDDAAKEELKKMEGTWLLVSAEENGNKVADDAVHANLLIKGDKLFVYVGKKIVVEGTLTVDPSKKPKTMDTVVALDKNVKSPAIYELDGDNLKICLGLKEQRPKEFTGKYGSDCGLYVYKRDK